MSFFTQLEVVSFNPWDMTVVPQALVMVLNINTSEIFMGETNNAGSFFVPLFPGQYAVLVSKFGFRDNTQLVGVGGPFQQITMAMVPTTGEPPPDPPTVVDVGFTVVDAVGNRVGGATVSLNGFVGATNSFGIVIFRDVPIAVLNWVVSLAGFNDSTGILDTSSITELEVVLIDISQPPPPPLLEHRITVNVLDPTGVPVPGVRIRATRIEGGFDFVILADQNGSAVFNNVLSGTYQIRVLSRSGTVFDEVAVFVGEDVTISLSVVIQWALSVSSTFGGSTDPSSGRDHFFTDGEIVPVSAKPLPLIYKFNEWDLDGQIFTDNPIDVEMLSDHTIHGTFELLETQDLIKPLLIIGGIVIVGLLVLRKPRAPTIIIQKSS